MICRIANKTYRAISHTKLRTAGMVAAERGHIPPVQWRWRIRLEFDRTVAGTVVAIGIVGRRGGRLTYVIDVFAPLRYRGFPCHGCKCVVSICPWIRVYSCYWRAELSAIRHRLCLT